MSLQEHRCVTIHCDGCSCAYMGYEDEFTIHFDSLAAFLEEQKDHEGEHNQWRVEGEQHFCGDCACERDGHLLDEDSGPVRWCRCQRRREPAP